MLDKFSLFLMKSKFIFVLFVLGFIYIVLPGPKSIDDFPSLEPSVKSDLDGDTWQNPNLVAYYSDYDRTYITNYYRTDLSKKLTFGLPLPVIRINHPPEAAYKYVRDQQESTFLEEYVFPMRESLFVNGYEPVIENIIANHESNFVGDHINFKETYYNSKATIRYYPSNVYVRIIVYLGIWVSIFGLYRIFLKLRNE